MALPAPKGDGEPSGHVPTEKKDAQARETLGMRAAEL